MVETLVDRLRQRDRLVPALREPGPEDAGPVHRGEGSGGTQPRRERGVPLGTAAGRFPNRDGRDRYGVDPPPSQQGKELIEDMKSYPLVLWAWTPGADRTTPPLSHEKFVEALEAWVSAGMPCRTGE